MPPLKAAFEDDTLAIAADENHLADLRLVKEIRGIPRVPPTRTTEAGGKGKKRHGDYAVGLALAYFASSMRWVEYAYRSVNRSAEANNGRMTARPINRDGQKRNQYRQPLGARVRGRL